MDDYMGAWQVYCNDDDVPVHDDDDDGCFWFQLNCRDAVDVVG